MKRLSPLPCPALLALLLGLMLTQPARAHRLEGEFQVNKRSHTIRVECWFETGDAPKVARVTVLRANREPLFPEPAEMKEGVFEFSYDKAEALTVEISAGQGHHKVLTITADQLATPGIGPGEVNSKTFSETPEPQKQDRGHGPDVQSLLLGVGFLLALAAFVLSVRNTRELRRWKDQLRRDEAKKRES